MFSYQSNSPMCRHVNSNSVCNAHKTLSALLKEKDYFMIDLGSAKTE